MTVNSLANDECRKRQDIKSEHLVYEGSICAFSRDRQGVCYGDSGSPLVANKQIIGLTAWIRAPNCARGFPDGYTRVSVFVDWIRKVSGILAV